MKTPSMPDHLVTIFYLADRVPYRYVIRAIIRDLLHDSCQYVQSVPLQGSRKLRFSDYVTMAQDGGNVVSLRHRPLFTPRIYSWYSFLLETESTPGHSAIGRIMSMKNSSDTIWTKRTSNL